MKEREKFIQKEFYAGMVRQNKYSSTNVSSAMRISKYVLGLLPETISMMDVGYNWDIGVSFLENGVSEVRIIPLENMIWLYHGSAQNIL